MSKLVIKFHYTSLMFDMNVARDLLQDQCITFDKQIEYYSTVYASLVQSLGEPQATNHLAKSLFAITIGSNDITHYVKSSAATKAKNPSQQFIDTLIQSLTGQLQVTLTIINSINLSMVATTPVIC